MSDFCATLILRAFKVLPGPDYNRTMGEYLEAAAEESARPLFYEIILPTIKHWESFRDKNYPSFVRYMRSHSIDPERPSGVIVAAFFIDQCYLIDGQDFVDVFAEMEGLDPTGLHSRFAQWR